MITKSHAFSSSGVMVMQLSMLRQPRVFQAMKSPLAFFCHKISSQTKKDTTDLGAITSTAKAETSNSDHRVFEF